MLSKNPNAIELLLEYPDKIYWPWLAYNPKALKILKKHPEKINWSALSQNPNPEAITLLKQNLEHVSWPGLCKNTNPEAIKLLRQNPEQINWSLLSGNPAAIELLKENPSLIHWPGLSRNPAIFINPWKHVIKPSVKMLSLQKRAVERVNHPDNLSQQGYFNDLETPEEPVDMVGKGSSYYHKQYDLQEAESKPGFDPEQFEIDYSEKVRSMGTLFGRKNLLKKVNAEIKYLQTL
jgi:hypothetical protein